MAPRGPLAAFVSAALLTLRCILPTGGLVIRNSSHAVAKSQGDVVIQDQNSSHAAAESQSDVVIQEWNSSHASAESQSESDGLLHSCLAGQRIVFIGPSTSKFDYIALAYFAEYGRWPVEDQVAVGAAGATGPNPLYEWNVRNALKAGQWLPPEVKAVNSVPGCNAGGGTETFMRYTNHIFNTHEVCDCHQSGDWKGVGDFYNSTENRVYVNGNSVISYFQWFGDTVSPRGTVDITPMLGPHPQAVNLQCPVGQFPGKWAWQSSVIDFLNNVVKYTSPTHLIISAAFWPTKPADTAFWEALAAAGASAVAGSQGQVYWRTTPQRTDHAQTDPASSVDTSPFVRHGWKIFDARNIVAQFQGARNNDEIYYDFTHLRPAPASFLGQTWLQQNVCPAAGIR